MLSRNSASGPGQETRPRSPPGMSPAKKFSPTSCTPASSIGADERVDLGVAGHRRRERPPELHGVEPGAPWPRPAAAAVATR